jgi:hypothetical protein
MGRSAFSRLVVPLFFAARPLCSTLHQGGAIDFSDVVAPA